MKITNLSDTDGVKRRQFIDSQVVGVVSTCSQQGLRGVDGDTVDATRTSRRLAAIAAL